MHARRFAVVSWCVVALVAPLATPPAQALVPQQVVAVAINYVSSEVTIVAGDTLRFTNADALATHDLVSLDRGPGGAFLFHSALLEGAGTSDVTGVSDLIPSKYPFYCSIHTSMTGNITVLDSLNGAT
jgi:plastocyanin